MPELQVLRGLKDSCFKVIQNGNYVKQKSRLQLVNGFCNFLFLKNYFRLDNFDNNRKNSA